MIRKITSFILLFVLAFCFFIPVHAHDSQDDHDKDLMRVLFGDDVIPKGAARDRFNILKDAAALCIDQFSSNDAMHSKEKTVYEPLASTIKLSYAFDEIDLNSKQNYGQNVTAQNHRSFTHQGWNYAYDNIAFWNKRKQILIDAVQQAVFSQSDTMLGWFPWLEEQVYGTSSNYNDEQRNAFCALIYYVHILGDHMEGKNDEQVGALLPLSRRDLLKSPGIIPELLEYLQVLFPSQRYSHRYLSLQNEMEDLAVKAEKNYYQGRTGIHTEDEIAKNKEFAEDFLELLVSYIPKLLSDESFFKKAFLS